MQRDGFATVLIASTGTRLSVAASREAGHKPTMQSIRNAFDFPGQVPFNGSQIGQAPVDLIDIHGSADVRQGGHRWRPENLARARQRFARVAHSGSIMESGMRMTALVPMLQTNDIMHTRKWYEEVLGFRCVSAAQDDGWCQL